MNLEKRAALAESTIRAIGRALEWESDMEPVTWPRLVRLARDLRQEVDSYIQAGMAPLPRWRRDEVAEPGWYWVRQRDLVIAGEPLPSRIVQAKRDGRTGRITLNGIRDLGGVEWAGPIALPED